MEAIWKKYYWLDFVKFANLFLSDHHELVAVKYFTATPLESEKEIRQSALFKANKFLNGEGIQFIKGKYYRKPIRCKATCNERFTIFEEKRTDVNISVEIMGDCAFDKTDLIILISADSDLVPTIEYVKAHFTDKAIKVYFPPCRRSNDIIDILGHPVVFLDRNKLKFEKAVMTPTVGAGEHEVTIPKEWIYTPVVPL